MPYDRGIAPTTCHRCGTDAGTDRTVPLGWSTSTSTADDHVDVVTLLCPGCTREHVRDIEAKLDEEWWP